MEECCTKESNLRVASKNGDLTVYVCSVCNRKHYEFFVDRAEIIERSNNG